MYLLPFPLDTLSGECRLTESPAHDPNQWNAFQNREMHCTCKHHSHLSSPFCRGHRTGPHAGNNSQDRLGSSWQSWGQLRCLSGQPVMSKTPSISLCLLFLWKGDSERISSLFPGLRAKPCPVLWPWLQLPYWDLTAGSMCVRLPVTQCAEQRKVSWPFPPD